MSKYTTESKVYYLTDLPRDISKKIMEWVIEMDNGLGQNSFTEWDFECIHALDKGDQMLDDWWVEWSKSTVGKLTYEISHWFIQDGVDILKDKVILLIWW